MSDIPAFPRQHTTADANDPTFKQGCEGMSLRDYFAAKALPACITELWGALDGTKEIAVAAYQIADAMLAAREVRL